MSTPESIAEQGNFLGFPTNTGEQEVDTDAALDVEELINKTDLEGAPPADNKPPVEHGDPEEEKERQRVEYWQSKADKYRIENEKLSFAAPVAKLLDEKPEIAAKIDELIQGKVETVPKKTEAQLLERPNMPAKPSDYDAQAAFTDPDSASFKFQQELTDYNVKLMEFYDKRDQLREKQAQDEAQRIQAQHEQNMRIAKVRVDLQKHGIQGEEADRFLEEMQSPKSVTIDNLVTLWKMKSVPSEQEKQNLARAEELKKRREKHNVPAPVVSASGEPQAIVPTNDESAAFSSSLFTFTKQRNAQR